MGRLPEHIAGRWPGELWQEITSRLKEEMDWRRYAMSYDKLLLKFSEYGQLVSSVVERLRRAVGVSIWGPGLAMARSNCFGRARNAKSGRSTRATPCCST